MTICPVISTRYPLIPAHVSVVGSRERWIVHVEKVVPVVGADNVGIAGAVLSIRSTIAVVSPVLPARS